MSNSEETKCPTCGRSDFASERGMKIHHTKSHGESLSIIYKNCEYCDNKFSLHSSRSDEARFCSNECMGKWNSENRIGENHQKWKPKHEKECEYCNSKFEVHECNVDTSRFCSNECHGNWNSENRVGEKHPNWEGGLTQTKFECGWCEETFQDNPSYRDEEERFCSRECRQKWMAEEFRGEDHWSWKGGSTKPYGALWPHQRQKAIERDDFECKMCYISQEEYKQEHGISLDVHHITPFREFDDNDKAHKLNNLITVCRPCHAKIEKHT